MLRAIGVTFLSIAATIYAINRPVYKIVLAQKGFAQFLQYDVDTPPLREFTFCTWIRVYDLDSDQTILSYVANGDNRVLRLWLDSGGQYIKVSINGRITSNVLVNVVKDVWRHVCLSYQSDFGAWALYVDSRLAFCEAAQSLQGFVLPGGGSVIIGYGTADNGGPNGLEGEIFGANMILLSTIERNFTMKVDPLFEQKPFSQNKLKKDSKYTNYLVLGNLQTDKIHNNFEKTYLSPFVNSSKNYIKVRTPHSFVEHSVGTDMTTKRPFKQDIFESQEILDITNKRGKLEYWNSDSFNKLKNSENYEMQIKRRPIAELLNSDTQNVRMVSQYETPPPPLSTFYFDKSFVTTIKSTPTESISNLKNTTSKSGKTRYRNIPVTELSDIETPPSQEQTTNVYGQWTGSKYAGSVLNYLKSINFNNRERHIRKIPQTIPLHKMSDSYPYSSDFKFSVLRPPSQFKRRNVVEKWYDVVKRDPQINVQIVEDDIRNNILRMHAKTQPRKVEIINRGDPKKQRERRFYRNTQYTKQNIASSSMEEEDKYYPSPFALNENKKHNHRYSDQSTINNALQGSENFEYQTVANSKDTYSKILSHANKWHNVKSYSNDYTPRKINMVSAETDSDRKIQYPIIRMKYIHENRKIVKENDLNILNGRKMALEISNPSTGRQGSVSIAKYNNGYISSQEEKNNKISHKRELEGTMQMRHMDDVNFDRHVKIGNALNERNVLGDDEQQKKKSFVGGDENIPDINRYRSAIDGENTGVPPSLGPRECKNIELYDRVLYVQPDESIDMTHILSPVREKNIAIEFIIQNYKKCSLTDSSLQNNALLFINWSKTPLRLFGGAYPKTTTDLCGFF